MPEQQKHSFSTGDIVVTTRDLRSPRADEGLKTIPKGTVGMVTGRNGDAWAHGDPHTRVNFGPYGVKMVQPEWLRGKYMLTVGRVMGAPLAGSEDDD